MEKLNERTIEKIEMQKLTSIHVKSYCFEKLIIIV